MLCIPDEPDFQDGQLAEKRCGTPMRDQLPADVVLEHSVQIRHGRAPNTRSTFWSYGPGVGLAAIEVKGGLVSVQLTFAGAVGLVPLPFLWLKDRLGSPLTSRFAYMARLPYTRVPADWQMAGVPPRSHH